MKVLAISAEKIRKLNLVELKLNGESFVVADSPGKGKTTLINLLWMAIAPKKSEKDIVQHGSEKASITVTLGDPESGRYDIIVTRKFTDSNPGGRITVKSADGKALKANTVKDLVNSLCFDPLEFINKKGRERAEMLLSVSDVDVEYLDTVESQYSELYNERAFLKKEAKRKQDALGAKPEKVDEVDISSEMELLKSLRQHNQRVDEIELRLTQLKGDKEKLLNSIETLKERLETENQKLTDINLRIEKGETIKAQNEKKPIEEVIDRIDNAQKINRNAARYEQYVKQSAIVGLSEKELANVISRMGELQEKKRDLIENSSWPVKGLRVEDGEVWYGKSVLDNCGESEKQQVSFAIAMATNPTLKCCRIDGAERLGEGGRQNILELAEANGYQVLMSRVSDTGAKDNEISIEEGEAKL